LGDSFREQDFGNAMAVRSGSLPLKAMCTEPLFEKVSFSRFFGSSFQATLFGHLVFAYSQLAYLLGRALAAVGESSCATNLGSYHDSMLSDSHQTICGDSIAC